ncbi:hypothetical protein, partial [Paenibacillus sp. HJGM_3]|uniref:hypothetical protein n=1 Tax=Paenibacillus sp. HJGM_3 TaxID=3379816 RepID=UPI00385F7F06
ETATEYIFTVTDGTEENTFIYPFGKKPLAGVTLADHQQSCKREAILLAQYEIDQKQPPTPINI